METLVNAHLHVAVNKIISYLHKNAGQDPYIYNKSSFTLNNAILCLFNKSFDVLDWFSETMTHRVEKTMKNLGFNVFECKCKQTCYVYMDIMTRSIQCNSCDRSYKLPKK